jgi:hypothetical protein
MNIRTALALLCVPTLASTIALADAPRINDYSAGMTVTAESDRPIVEIVLPDAVYLGITRTDLADVRVFNSDGNAVPHAVCSSAAALASTTSRESLNVFQVHTAPKSTDGPRVQVQTPAGTQVQVNEAVTTATGTAAPASHVIDARAVPGELRAIEFEWSSPDGAAEARVQIQSSDDLDSWRTEVTASTLLQVIEGGQQLRRKSVPLPQRHYNYLRVWRVDGGPALNIESAQGIAITRGEAIDPVWFVAEAQPGSGSHSLSFASQRLAPITYARLRLAEPNSSMRIVLESRDAEQAPWHRQWTGEFYSIVAEGTPRSSPPAQFERTWDRQWRVEPARQGDPFYDSTVLELGYRPAKLRFLAQGAGPFTLAYGSRRAEPAPAQSCDRLLSDVKPNDLVNLIGAASVAQSHSLGGDTALKPLPVKTPTRLVVLWGVLIGGVALLIAMALSLIRRLKQADPAKSP